MESLAKKFYPEERNVLEVVDESKDSLLKTILISKNLFQLTERLPRSKYHNRTIDPAVLEQAMAGSQSEVRNAQNYNTIAAVPSKISLRSASEDDQADLGSVVQSQVSQVRV